MDAKAYTVKEVAKILHVRKGLIYDLIYTGQLRAIRLSERRFRITSDSIKRFWEQQEKKTMKENCITSALLVREENSND